MRRLGFPGQDSSRPVPGAKPLAWLIAVVLLCGSFCGSDGTGIAYAAIPASTVDITVPVYTTSKVAGYDHVSIPGGLTYAVEEGRPEVPYLVKVVDYPAGTVRTGRLKCTPALWRPP